MLLIALQYPLKFSHPSILYIEDRSIDGWMDGHEVRSTGRNNIIDKLGYGTQFGALAPIRLTRGYPIWTQQWLWRRADNSIIASNNRYISLVDKFYGFYIVWVTISRWGPTTPWRYPKN